MLSTPWRQIRSWTASFVLAVEEDIQELLLVTVELTWLGLQRRFEMLRKTLITCIIWSYQWIFHPPKASHMNGAVECLIRSVKQALPIVLQGQVLTQETLDTELQATINTQWWPTRSHGPYPEFLPDSASVLNVEDKEINSRKRHRQSLAFANMFWHRWCREYLPGLIIRPKRTSETRNLVENDFVLLVEANTPRDHWPLGHVVQVPSNEEGWCQNAKWISRSTSYQVVPSRRSCHVTEIACL